MAQKNAEDITVMRNPSRYSSEGNLRIKLNVNAVELYWSTSTGREG